MPQIQYSEKYYDDVYEYRYAFILLRENVRSELGLHGRICPENAERWEDFRRFRLFSLSLLFALERWFENFKREGRVYVVFSSSLRHEKEGKNGKMRERSSNSSSPSSSASSSLGCRGGWENIAFFLTFPSNHRSLSLWNSYTQTRGFTAGYRQVLAEEQIVERGAFYRASFCRFFSFFFPDRRPLRGGGGGGCSLFFSSFPLCFENMRRKRRREKKNRNTHQNIFLSGFKNAKQQTEWRGLGVQQSRGWVHYAIHRPEPHIMLYRRPLNYGQAPLGDANKWRKQKYKREIKNQNYSS